MGATGGRSLQVRKVQPGRTAGRQRAAKGLGASLKPRCRTEQCDCSGGRIVPSNASLRLHVSCTKSPFHTVGGRGRQCPQTRDSINVPPTH